MSEPTAGTHADTDLGRHSGPRAVPTQPTRGRHTPLPTQAGPAHEQRSVPPTAHRWGRRPAGEAAVVDSAHWTRSSTGRRGAGLLVAASLLATLAAGYASYDQQFRGDAPVVLVVMALLTVAIYAVMATTKPMVVDLQGSIITVHHHNRTEVFDLANPFQVVETRGHLGSPSWSLALGREDGSTLVIGSRTVKASTLHAVVVHHRHRAEQVRRDRLERFGS